MPNKESSGGFWPQWGENKLFALLLAILLVYGIVYLCTLVRKTALEADQVGIAARQPSMITVTATDKASVAPDIATVDLGVTNTAATPEKAQSDNAAKTNALLDALKALGIAPADIQTSNYSVNPSYDYNSSPAKVVGYDANQTVTVKIRNQDLVSSVLQKSVSLGATNVNGLQFTVDDPAAVEADARAKAIAKAYEEAAAIAGAMHARVGAVISYSEADNNGPIFFAPSAISKDAGGAAPSVAPGQTEVSKTVTIEFAIK